MIWLPSLSVRWCTCKCCNPLMVAFISKAICDGDIYYCNKIQWSLQRPSYIQTMIEIDEIYQYATDSYKIPITMSDRW